MEAVLKDAVALKKEFVAAGFEVADLGANRMEVKKSGCFHALERNSSGEWMPSGPPRFAVRGDYYELEDGGYQKFWYLDGKRLPAHASEMKTLHNFDQEVRYILGLKSLYHESLGTTNARTVYDRVTGRPDQ